MRRPKARLNMRNLGDAMTIAMDRDEVAFFKRLSIPPQDYLHLALKFGAVKIFQYAVSLGANLWQPDEEKRSALYNALEGENADNAFILFKELVLKHGCDPKEKIAGMSLLHIAAQRNAQKIVEFLLDQGLPIDEKAPDGSTPLFFAVKKHPQMVDLLLSKGANVNIINTLGITPLWMAASAKYPSKAIFESLMAHHADPDVLNNKTKENLVYFLSKKGESNGHSDMIKIIKPNPQEAAELIRQAAEAETARQRIREEKENAARLAEEERVRQAAEAKVRQAAEEKARQEAEEEKARQAAEEKARQEAEEEKARQEAEEEKARQAAEENARQEAEEAKVRQAAEEKARQEAEEEKARQAAEEARKKAEANTNTQTSFLTKIYNIVTRPSILFATAGSMIAAVNAVITATATTVVGAATDAAAMSTLRTLGASMSPLAAVFTGIFLGTEGVRQVREQIAKRDLKQLEEMGGVSEDGNFIENEVTKQYKEYFDEGVRIEKGSYLEYVQSCIFASKKTFIPGTDAFFGCQAGRAAANIQAEAQEAVRRSKMVK